MQLRRNLCFLHALLILLKLVNYRIYADRYGSVTFRFGSSKLCYNGLLSNGEGVVENYPKVCDIIFCARAYTAVQPYRRRHW